MCPVSRPYHHGNLRAALLEAAVVELAEVGPAAMSLRKVAARAGVTHPAATHHFGDKRGLLTAVAAEGYRRFAAALDAAGSFLDKGAAYLSFAYEHRPYFEVMFRPELLRTDDPDLAAARAAAGEQLQAGARSASGRPGGDTNLAIAGWALVHGIATLWLAGNLDADTIEEAKTLFRRSARLLSARPPRAR
jgi:AcrR family transcriptional regulator